MKSILLSIKPEWLAKILNGEKTIEVRKLFPKDYVGWVYLYCSKGKDLQKQCSKIINGKMIDIHWNTDKDEGGFIGFNGKVVARFWCDEVLPIIKVVERCGLYYYTCQTERFYYNPDKLTFQSCLNTDQIRDYLGDKNGCAIHFSKLEIFDRPRELGEFYITHITINVGKKIRTPLMYPRSLTKAPQNYCYIEGE